MMQQSKTLLLSLAALLPDVAYVLLLT